MGPGVNRATSPVHALRIWGLYFFNTDARMKEFDEEFAELTGRDIDPYAAMKVAEEPGKYGE